MTIEQIEKAAKEAVQNYFQCNGKYPCEERDYCAFCNGQNSAFDCREDCSADDYNEGFIDGAQWRINSVWHEPSAYGEELKRDVEVIAKTKRGFRFGKFGVVGYSNEYIGFVSTSSLEYALSDVLEYAYLDDLIPERKEKTE